MSSAVVGNDGRPLVSVISAGTIKDTTNSDVNMHAQYAYAGLSEIFTPMTSQYAEASQATALILPSVHGIPIGGSVSYNATALPASVNTAKIEDPLGPPKEVTEGLSTEDGA